MCCLFLWSECVQIGGRKEWKETNRVSGEEINVMSDISKSNMHESTMPPMAQQTNSQIKEQPAGKLPQRSSSLYKKKQTKNRQRGKFESFSHFLRQIFSVALSTLLPLLAASLLTPQRRFRSGPKPFSIRAASAFSFALIGWRRFQVLSMLTLAS